MRKLIFISLTIFLACGAVFAAPSKRLPVKITQSDGSVVTLTKEGDEHCHFFSTADGLAVYENENGDYCYLGAEGKTSMLAHEQLMRSAAETAFIATLGDKPIAASVRKMNKAAKKSEKKNGGAVICHGTPNVPVVLIQYQDTKLLGDPLENFEEFLHGQNGCEK